MAKIASIVATTVTKPEATATPAGSSPRTRASSVDASSRRHHHSAASIAAISTAPALYL